MFLFDIIRKKGDDEMLITLEEYADKIGVTFSTVRSAIHRGRLKPEKKIGKRWYIDSDTKWVSKKNIDKSISYTRIYNIWRMIKQRCYNKNATRYKNYGGKGVKMCEEWKNDSRAFFEWSLNNGYKENLQIDRIDANGDYCPDNCHWVTIQENLKHRDEDRKKGKQ